MHRASGKAIQSLVHLSLSIAEYDGLCDGECIVEITEGVKLPLFLLHCHKELFDTLKSQFITAGEGRGDRFIIAGSVYAGLEVLYVRFM